VAAVSATAVVPAAEFCCLLPWGDHMLHSSEVRFTRAVEEFEFEGAFRCLYRSYFRRGLISANSPRQLRLTRHHLLSETRVFLARIGRRVIGTLTLVEDRPLGVPMRSIFDRQVETLAGADPRIAEAGCLAVDDSRPTGRVIVHHLMGLAAQAASRRGISRILIAVHPRHAPFYERAAGFRRFTEALPYPSMQGSPAIGLELNLSTLRVDSPQAWRRYFGMSFSPRALSTRRASPAFLRQLATLWQSLQAQEAAQSHIFEMRPHSPGVQAGALMEERPFIGGKAHISRAG